MLGTADPLRRCGAIWNVYAVHQDRALRLSSKGNEECNRGVRESSRGVGGITEWDIQLVRDRFVWALNLMMDVIKVVETLSNDPHLTQIAAGGCPSSLPL
ncbi:hypothetical protein ACS0TY_020936 [Phlomoides rotata]